MKLDKDQKKNLYDSMLELYCVTSTQIPHDVQKEVLKALKREKKNTTAKYAMEIIDKNIELASLSSNPVPRHRHGVGLCGPPRWI